MTNYKNLSDKELYALCKEYGLAARVWRRRFAGLLPEVARRRLYKKKGYTSLHEFAAKLAGMSKEAVDKVLCISRKLEGKPLLKEQLISGEQGWTKLEKVAYIATPETDKYWAERVESMTQLGLEAYVHELRETNAFEQNNRLELTLKSESQPEKTSIITFHMRPELERKFRMYKHELEQERKEPLTCENALEALLNGKSFVSAKMSIQICPHCVERKSALV
ncbi:MAG: hypothetical protein WC924_03265 [Candidatus Gracilibacteria bacterium]